MKTTRAFRIRKQCFTLVELLGVMAISGILIAGTAVGMNRVWLNNRIDTCESELREMTAAVKNYHTDCGNLTLDASDTYDAKLAETVGILNDEYMPYELEITEIGTDRKSAVMNTKLQADPWGNRYMLRAYTYDGADADSVPGMVVIASAGPDGVFETDSYSSGNFGDDILAIVEPKT